MYNRNQLRSIPHVDIGKKLQKTGRYVHQEAEVVPLMEKKSSPTTLQHQPWGQCCTPGNSTGRKSPGRREGGGG